MEYSKIQSLYKRDGIEFDENGKFKSKSKDVNPLKIGDYSEPEFGNIRNWQVDEKIDGTNIRIIFKKDENGNDILLIKGRTEKSSIPKELLLFLHSKFTIELLSKAFRTPENSPDYVILFGEGYGGKIQKGSNYRKDYGFCMFDIFVSGWWLKKEDIEAIGKQLDIEVAPTLGIMKEEEILEFVKSHPKSKIAQKEYEMEGIVARPFPPMNFRNNKPIKFKLRCGDFPKPST